MDGNYVLNGYQQEVCLEFQTSNIKQGIFTQTETEIIYDHCNQAIFSTYQVVVPNYFVVVIIGWLIIVSLFAMAMKLKK